MRHAQRVNRHFVPLASCIHRYIRGRACEVGHWPVHAVNNLLVVVAVDWFLKHGWGITIPFILPDRIAVVT